MRKNPANPHSKWNIVKREKVLYFFVIPAILTTFVFSYLPMFGNVIAFLDYDMSKGWMGLGSEFVGLKWFKQIFTDPFFRDLILRTIYYNFLILVVGFPAPILLALLINEVRNRRFKKTVQTISYLPYFVSWVTISSLIYIFLSTDATGVINNIRTAIGQERYLFMKDANFFPWLLLLSSIFKTAGWGSILYLAAISSIDAQLYEAAMIDGAGKWKQFCYVTFPGILPTMVIMMIMNLGSFFTSNFEQVYNLQNQLISSSTNVISVYTFTAGVKGQQFSIAAAVGLFQGVLNAILLILSNFASKKITDYGLF